MLNLFQPFVKVWERAEYEFSKAALWLFSISHIILVSCLCNSYEAGVSSNVLKQLTQAASTFDMSYVRTFRIVDALRCEFFLLKNG